MTGVEKKNKLCLGDVKFYFLCQILDQTMTSGIVEYATFWWSWNVCIGNVLHLSCLIFKLNLSHVFIF